MFLYVVGKVHGVTQLGDIVYVICHDSPIIKMFTANTLSPLGEDIHVEGMRDPWDIVACRNDRQLYVADYGGDCIWRVSVDDKSYVKWLMTFNVVSLSLTSQRLLVTSSLHGLRQYSTTDSRQLRDILLPEYMKQEVNHIVESLRQTFIVAHRGTSRDVQQYAVNKLFTFCCVSSSRKLMMMIIIINNTTSTTSNNNDIIIIIIIIIIICTVDFYT